MLDQLDQRMEVVTAVSGEPGGKGERESARYELVAPPRDHLATHWVSNRDAHVSFVSGETAFLPVVPEQLGGRPGTGEDLV